MTNNSARQPAGVPVGGQFATMTKSEAAGVTLGTPAAAPDIEALAAERDQIMELWEDHSDRTGSAFAHLDQRMQHAAVNLAAAAVRRDYPGARTLVLRENEDGEYKPMAVNYNNGTPIINDDAGDDWTRNEVAGENSVNLSELACTLSIDDYGWAEGIASVYDDRHGMRVAVIDLDAVMDKPAPLMPGSKADLFERYETTRDTTAAARRQYRSARDADQHAAVQLAAASILERYPEADTLHLAENTFEPGGAMAIISISGPEGEIAHVNEDEFNLEPGDDGTPDLEELLRDLDTSSMAWNEGISTVHHDEFNGYRVAINLKAALAKPAPEFKA